MVRNEVSRVGRRNKSMYELERKTPDVKRGRSKSVGKNLRLGERDFLLFKIYLGDEIFVAQSRYGKGSIVMVRVRMARSNTPKIG